MTVEETTFIINCYHTVIEANKFPFFNENIFPIFKVEQHIKAHASRKATYSKFKFKIMIFFLLLVLVPDISQMKGKQFYFTQLNRYGYHSQKDEKSLTYIFFFIFAQIKIVGSLLPL